MKRRTLLALAASTSPTCRFWSINYYMKPIPMRQTVPRQAVLICYNVSIMVAPLTSVQRALILHLRIMMRAVN